jgi:hypothetical protein
VTRNEDAQPVDQKEAEYPLQPAHRSRASGPNECGSSSSNL